MPRPAPPRPVPRSAGRAEAGCWLAAWTSGSSAGGIPRRCSGRCPGPGSITARGSWPGSTRRPSTRRAWRVMTVPGSWRRAARAATWPEPSRRPSNWWASAPAWCRAVTAWSAACCSRSGCWAGPSPGEPGRCGSRTGSARRSPATRRSEPPRWRRRCCTARPRARRRPRYPPCCSGWRARSRSSRPRRGCSRRRRGSTWPGGWWQAAARPCFCPYPDLVIVPLTGLQYEIEAGHYRATVTELGAGLRELAFRGKPVIAGHEPDELPPAGAGQLLAPWPNRVDGGRYVFGGTEYELALTEPARANAIHGLTRWTPWTAIRQDPSLVRLRSAPHGQQGYPFCLEIEAEYRLDAGTGLQVTVAARNRGSHAAPYGTGSHPYLTVRTPSVDGCELTLPANSWLPLDDRGIPSGPPEPVDGTAFDFRQARVIGDRKSTRLNSSHSQISYAVFC